MTALPRWLDYSPLGTPLRGTSLLPIKLPIPKEHSRNIPKECWFTDNDLLNYCSDMGYPLACIIDLTYTNYYDPKVFFCLSLNRLALHGTRCQACQNLR